MLIKTHNKSKITNLNKTIMCRRSLRRVLTSKMRNNHSKNLNVRGRGIRINNLLKRKINNKKKVIPVKNIKPMSAKFYIVLGDLTNRVTIR